MPDQDGRRLRVRGDLAAQLFDQFGDRELRLHRLDERDAGLQRPRQRRHLAGAARAAVHEHDAVGRAPMEPHGVAHRLAMAITASTTGPTGIASIASPPPKSLAFRIALAGATGAQRAGSVGPNRLTTGTPAAPSRCPTPLSLASRTEKRWPSAISRSSPSPAAAAGSARSTMAPGAAARTCVSTSPSCGPSRKTGI